jgi:hypothetical protein
VEYSDLGWDEVVNHTHPLLSGVQDNDDHALNDDNGA